MDKLKGLYHYVCICFCKNLLLAAFLYVPVRMHFSEWFDVNCIVNFGDHLGCLDILYALLTIYLAMKITKTRMFWEKRKKERCKCVLLH